MNLVWFRVDLRLADNPALFHALNQPDPTSALFILNPEQHQIHGEAPQKYEFIKAHINDLVKRLTVLNVRSIVCEVPRFSAVPERISEVVKTHRIKQVFFNKNHWLNETQRDQAVVEGLAKTGVVCQQFDANYLLPPGSVRKADGSMYHVFTPYKNRFIQRLMQDHQPPCPVPQASESKAQLPEVLPTVGFQLPNWPIGEAAVAEMVKQFLRQADYKAQRDHPAIKGTSRLSPYLAIGVISARQCLAHALKWQGEQAFYSTWLSELIWRDFYNDLMFEYPRLARHQPFSAKATDVWHHNPDLFSAWQAGKTGFPVIDAGMRQLKTTGWMHNRVRMLTAAFLSKLCLIDWRLGEQHFMANLLDGDLASNNGGWQWSSGTGCDAAPYFRIFNPTTQSKRFDAEGAYIRQYVEELKDVPKADIHDPPEALRQVLGYPQPVIDYRSARLNALDWFKSQRSET